MPTYEYVCASCGHEFERFQKISDEPVRDCPGCGAPEADRKISAGAGIVFKGSGFYATDYRDSGKPGKRSAGEGGEGASDGGGESGADGDDGADSPTGSGGSSENSRA